MDVCARFFVLSCQNFAEFTLCEGNTPGPFVKPQIGEKQRGPDARNIRAPTSKSVNSSEF